MAKLPIADRKTQSEAKKLFPYKSHNAEMYAGLGMFAIHKDKKYFYHNYKDEELNNWVSIVRRYMENEELLKKATAKWLEKLGYNENEFEDEEDWRVDVKKLAAQFPKGKIPEKIKKLAQLQNRKKEYISSFFITDDGADYFGNYKSPNLNEKIIIFGGYIDGTRFAYWLNNCTLSKAPIVLIDHEGSSTSVIANSLDDFLRILAVDDECIVLEEDEEGESEEDKKESRRVLRELGCSDDEIYDSNKEIKKLRQWLLKNYGIKPSKFPYKLKENARKKHPDFKKWLNKMI